MVIAALVARIFGLLRSALGAGGGRATTWGDAASADKSFTDGCEGMTTGGASPSVGLLRGRGRGVFMEPGEKADIMACRCMGVHIECEDERWEANRDTCCARCRRATTLAILVPKCRCLLLVPVSVSQRTMVAVEG
jgi:hypothetical protein